MKRREPLNLAHVLEERPASAIPVPIIEKRIHIRFDKAFLVVIGSELYGDTVAVARNISAGGILVEMTYAPPLGTVVTVHFQYVRDEEQLERSETDRAPGAIDELVVRAEVKHHHYLNFTGGNDAASARAIGLRFLEFVDPDERIPPERWH
ncbi:MAG TPA: hypothetical protein VHT91_09925 [Kofleriaceae bacterium]|nr:hypothetical protein [Kofleriaceae bacterium]